MNTTRLSRRSALAALGATASPWLWAQSAMQGRPIDTQGRPITWLVGQPAGGTTDVLTRVVARALARQLDQAVVGEKRPGGAGGSDSGEHPRPDADAYPQATDRQGNDGARHPRPGAYGARGHDGDGPAADLGGTAGRRQKKSRGLELRHLRQRHQPASDRRVAQSARPDADDACSIQGR